MCCVIDIVYSKLNDEKFDELIILNPRLSNKTFDILVTVHSRVINKTDVLVIGHCAL